MSLNFVGLFNGSHIPKDWMAENENKYSLGLYPFSLNFESLFNFSWDIIYLNFLAKNKNNLFNIFCFTLSSIKLESYILPKISLFFVYLIFF